MPQFVSRARSLSFVDAMGRYELIKGLSLPCTWLTCLQVHRIGLTLSQCMTLLLQIPSLEECSFYIIAVDVEEGDSDQLTLPLIGAFTLYIDEDDMAIDEIIRHFELPNLTRLKLDLFSSYQWSTESYETIKSHCSLCHIQDLQLLPDADKVFTIASSTILKDAPLLRRLDAASVATIDQETLAGISSGDLGCFLKSFTISCSESDVEAVLNMLEAHQKAVIAQNERASNWREVEFVGLKEVMIKVFWDGSCGRPERLAAAIYKRWIKSERLDKLGHLGVCVKMLAWPEIDMFGIIR